MKVCEINISYSNENKGRVKINSSKDTYRVALDNWNMNTIELQEEAKILLLNRAGIVTGIFHLSKGGITTCYVDLKLVLSVAIKAVASGIILLHNHPSGNLQPSKADLQITRRLKLATSLVDIRLFDHLIVTKEGYYSLADNKDL
ncbi:JAB domain-containing protein [Sinomicrobium kalidii]|uniref:JAB domain-containing protein n=1 Tax=Sinomicrobium kalidii TaxID=2900738 RepID=UPI001E4E5197|nr:JAB domain-containing protein [Sinomicrobium kalidii]UGU14239.1 JAB domain-containing protein [Sinomicrobium kalidii]